MLLLLGDQFLCLCQLYCNTAFVISNIEKDFHEDNLSFVLFTIS